MTKEEIMDRVKNNEPLANILHFTAGDGCLIYKADHFQPGDQVIYIPDTHLNEVELYDTNLIPEDVRRIEACLYTGDDFIEITCGSKALAERVFDYCDWSHPSTAALDLLDSDELYEKLNEAINMLTEIDYMYAVKGLDEIINKLKEFVD